MRTCGPTCSSPRIGPWTFVGEPWTVKVAQLRASPVDGWTTRGAYRLGMVNSIQDYATNRFRILATAHWDWLTPSQDKRSGELWKIEAMLVEPLTAAPHCNN